LQGCKIYFLFCSHIGAPGKKKQCCVAAADDATAGDAGDMGDDNVSDDGVIPEEESKREAAAAAAAQNSTLARRRIPPPGELVYAAAAQWIGTPYVRGGGNCHGPTRGGFDNSGTGGFTARGLEQGFLFLALLLAHQFYSSPCLSSPVFPPQCIHAARCIYNLFPITPPLSGLWLLPLQLLHRFPLSKKKLGSV
jgi:hypothetical protein